MNEKSEITFDILRWDAVKPYNNPFPMPMIYFKPIESKNVVDFASFALDNNYTAIINIKNSSSEYDNANIIGFINPSYSFPSYRPNFYNETGLWTVTLGASWIGYPKMNGTISIKLPNAERTMLSAVNSDVYVPPKPLPFYAGVDYI